MSAARSIPDALAALTGDVVPSSRPLTGMVERYGHCGHAIEAHAEERSAVCHDGCFRRVALHDHAPLPELISLCEQLARDSVALAELQDSPSAASFLHTVAADWRRQADALRIHLEEATR